MPSALVAAAPARTARREMSLFAIVSSPEIILVAELA
jgi:hypothetical protein